MDIRYSFQRYVTSYRWSSYWHQISETLSVSPESVLIVGDGDGIVKRILSNIIDDVQSADLIKDTGADHICSVENLSEVVRQKFDCVVCCQVLEHLPRDRFEICLRELSITTSKYCILSLPQKVWSFGFSLTLFSRNLKFLFSIQRKNIEFPYVERTGHYWEIGTKGASRKEVETCIEKYFTILHKYNNKNNTYHRFFVLKKKNN